jgi:hypothetical protein
MPYFDEFEEVYFLCTVWNFVGPCGLQERIISGSYQDSNDSIFTTIYISRYSKICLTLCNLAQKAFFHFPMQTYHPCLINPELKIHIFPHVCTLPTIQHVYTQAAPLQPVYIGICAKK